MAEGPTAGRPTAIVPRRPRRSPRRGAPPALGTDCALFLDIDGTLLEFAARPERVLVDTGIAALLPALVGGLGGAVALITGRSLADADRLFPGLSLAIAGQHGLERRAADGSVHVHGATSVTLQRLRSDLARLVARHEGLVLEDKGTTLALHYRQAPRLASYVHRVLRAQMAAATDAARWQLQPGKRVVEIRPNGRDKGTAIAEYLAEPPFRGRLPVFVGDDRTDEYGFAAVTRTGGWAVKVGPGPTQARYRLSDVSAVRRWLADALLPRASNEQVKA